MEPIYRSDGAWVAVYQGGYLFNVDGEWIGFVRGREVFDTTGLYLGFLSDDRRLLRKRVTPDKRPRLQPPPRPEQPPIPASVPLAPLLRSLPYQIIDIFEHFPDRMAYDSESRRDME